MLSPMNHIVYPIRILHIITSLYQGGGAENHLLALARSMDRNKFQLSIAYMQPYHDLCDDFHQLGIHTYPLNCKNWVSPKSFIKLLTILQKGNYDIVHSHLYPADLYAFLALRLIKRTDWLSSHHNRPEYFMKPPHRQISAIIYQRASKIVAISESVKEYVATNCSIAKKNIEKIYYGLNEEHFLKSEASQTVRVQRDDLGIANDDFVITIVGRLVPVKGHIYAIQAIQQLAAQQSKVKLLIVGDGPLKAELQKLVTTLNLENRISFLGLRQDVAQIMALSDIILLSSLSEGFGLVLLEAMAVRRCIVASEVGAIPEIVVNGVTGLLVPPSNSNAIAMAITSLEQNPLLKDELGVAGYSRLKQHFTVEQMARKTEELYCKVLSKKVKFTDS